MKNLVRVSLSVLAAVALISFVGCKNDSEPEPAPANFEGEWKSTDGAGAVSIKDGNFTTVMYGQELKGTYTVDGKTATTSKVQFPVDEGTTVSASFTMEMVDGNDVMKLTVPAEVTQDEPFVVILGKKTSTKSDLTGTWTTGEVPIDEEGTLGEATIVVTNNSAAITLPGQQKMTATVTQDGNFFTITWRDDHHGGELTGLISASGKVWLYNGSLFTRK